MGSIVQLGFQALPGYLLLLRMMLMALVRVRADRKAKINMSKTQKCFVELREWHTSLDTSSDTDMEKFFSDCLLINNSAHAIE